MKKIIFIYSLICLVFTSCQEDNLEKINKDTDKSKVRFSLSIPDYHIPVSKNRSTSYENAVNDLWIMAFDVNGLFLEKVHVSNLVSQESNGIGSGSFEATIPNDAVILHFIANCDQIASFDDMVYYQKDEREIIPELSSDAMAFWGRNVVTSYNNPVNVTLYRNQAKVTVSNQGATNFSLTGYALGNFITRGTIAPFNPNATPTPFVLSENLPTVPQGTIERQNQNEANCDLTPKYMFANPNYFNDQTYVIIKGKMDNGPELFYKIQLLDENKQPYPVIRNTNYRVAIQSFSKNAKGSTTFGDAMNAAPSNNIYADIFKESPTIADDKNNILTVGSVNVLFVQGGTLNIPANYTQNGTLNNSQISVSVVDDQGSIVNGLAYNSSTGIITANIAQILVGQQQATIQVKAGVLSRTITVNSSALYDFTPASFTPAIYTGRDQSVTLNFNIPSTIPSYLFPIQYVITTNNLYPVAPNQDLVINYDNGNYQYAQWVYSPGQVSLNFKTAFDNSDEMVTIQNKYFNTASVPLQSRHFENVSINNGTNLVNYGQGSVAALTFSLSDIAGAPATYPVTVVIATDNLTTAQAGWTAVSGGYSHTYTSAPSGVQTVQFTSNKAISLEDIVISANGFNPTTISYDNVLATNVNISGHLYYDGYSWGYTATSNNTNSVPHITARSNGNYTSHINQGAKLSDAVMFTAYRNGYYYAYYGSYTVRQLLEDGTINMVSK